MSIDGTTVLVTGGTGSFGNAFATRMVEEFPTTTVRIFSRDEMKQYQMAERFGDHPNLRFLIGDVRDRSRLIRAMDGVDTVVHAAAMKHVPLCEYNPFEAVQTNVLGTQNVVDAAIDAGVGRVVALSTDKAVNPINLYGATKLCAEKIVVQGNAYAATRRTRLSCVRYGNVVGSRGSVVPLFQRQRADGRLTVTDERMTRFWITLEQAVDLVLSTVDRSVGGEIFVPRIPSMRVVDLARAVAGDLPVDIVGIRPGEKLHEVLLTGDESRHAVEMADGFVIVPEHPWWTDAELWADGKPLDEDFVYSSDRNDRWLDVEQLRAMLA
jgi:UDP-N-acetylglucosamine 4,6-dehydratase